MNDIEIAERQVKNLVTRMGKDHIDPKQIEGFQQAALFLIACHMQRVQKTAEKNTETLGDSSV